MLLYSVAKFGDHRHSCSEDIMAFDHQSKYPSMLSGRRYCEKRDIMVLVSHVISQDHVTNGSSNFMWRSRSR